MGWLSGWSRFKNFKFFKKCQFEKFKEQISKCRFLSEEELLNKWKEFGVNKDDKLVSCEVASQFGNKYPLLSRDTGAGVLQLIYDGVSYELNNSIDFANDSLFCEWAYVIDLDKNTFEVYEGFNKSSLFEEERFYKKDDKGVGEYYPVKLKKLYSLDELPSEEDFLKLDEDEED